MLLCRAGVKVLFIFVVMKICSLIEKKNVKCSKNQSSTHTYPVRDKLNYLEAYDTLHLFKMLIYIPIIHSFIQTLLCSDCTLGPMPGARDGNRNRTVIAPKKSVQIDNVNY